MYNCFACLQVRCPRCSARSRSVFRVLSKLTAQAQWLMHLTLRMARLQRLPFSSSLHSARVSIQRSLHSAITSSPCRCSVVELQGAVKASSASPSAGEHATSKSSRHASSQEHGQKAVQPLFPVYYLSCCFYFPHNLTRMNRADLFRSRLGRGCGAARSAARSAWHRSP